MDEIDAAINDDTTRAFYNYWKDRKAGRLLPRWQDFDPVEMRDWLGWINVVEVVGEGDGCRFRYRVHGDQLSDFLGVEMTGKYADEIPRASVRERAVAGYRLVADREAPDLVHYVDTHANDRLVKVQRLTVPVVDDGKMLLVSFFRFEP